MSVVPIQGLWETHLTVSDLDRSIAFYRDVIGLQLAHTVPARHAAFFWMGPPRKTMLGLWSILSVPMKMSLHIAFEVSVADIQASVAGLKGVGLQPTTGGGKPIDDPEVIPWIPAASVYFRDPDGHSLEYIAPLPDPPDPVLKRMSLAEWRQLQSKPVGSTSRP